MKLLIDIGNTSSKLAVADGERFVHNERLAEPWADALRRLHSDFAIERIVVSCVGRAGVELRALLEAAPAEFAPYTWLAWNTPCALHDVPCGYGADRLAADIGAYSGQPALLVVDAGTCITYDLILNGRIEGSVISPGLQLRLNAMHDYTAALPRVQAYSPDAADKELAPLMAFDTEGSMLSAAHHGTRFEVEGYVRSLRALYPSLEVVLTGGNRIPLSPDIPHAYDPNLVLRGLARIE